MRRLPSLPLALVLAIAVGVAVLTLRSGTGPGIEIERRDPSPGIDEIMVHVSGAVLHPGIVTAAPGDRVADAVTMAGGALPDADLGALNLARRLADQDRVRVPLLGEAAPLIDLNRATAEELEALPGIGPVRAAAVIASRLETGPFTTSDDLLERRLIPESVYEAIRDLVTAR